MSKKISRVTRILTNIAKGIAIDAGVDVVRGYVLYRLRSVTALDFQKAIKEGTHTLGVTDDKDRSFARKWTPIMEKLSINGQKLQQDKLTPANVLEWLKVDRPDLANVVISMKSEGMLWLENDVKEMFNFLFPPAQLPQPTQHLTLKRVTVEASSESIVKVDQSTKEGLQQSKDASAP